MIWFCMPKSKIIGYYSFYETSATSEIYKKMLCYFAMPKVLGLPASLVLQQDRTPSFWSVDVRGYLSTKAPQLWIDQGDQKTWPQRSSDLATPCFLLWGYVKKCFPLYGDKSSVPYEARD